MPVWTDHNPVGQKPAAAISRVGRLTALLLSAALCLSPVAALGEEPIGPMVMSNFRHSRFPTPDVPACERVEDAYFSGAVLIGDSVAEGLGIHNLIPELEVVTVIGLSPRTAATDVIFTHERQPVTLVDKLVAMQPSMVYLWLGSNGVDTKDAARVIDDYDRLLNVLLSAMPDTLFYLLELSPVKRIAQEKYINYTNERVNEFNAMLREVAQRHNVYLMPINFLLKNEKGLLDGEYGAGDGIHLRKAGYWVISEYLYTHTVPMENEG
ncbi:GDSL-type esterase/lipase family protein [Eubacteriales bacterium OttesenSCG-928-A19]|nr:GDSL-type esterase/lipase family protein [Eubacteriales bacterium OttesenSCG-928-A19]